MPNSGRCMLIERACSHSTLSITSLVPCVYERVTSCSTDLTGARRESFQRFRAGAVEVTIRQRYQWLNPFEWSSTAVVVIWTYFSSRLLFTNR